MINLYDAKANNNKTWIPHLIWSWIAVNHPGSELIVNTQYLNYIEKVAVLFQMAISVIGDACPPFLWAAHPLPSLSPSMPAECRKNQPEENESKVGSADTSLVVWQQTCFLPDLVKVNLQTPDDDQRMQALLIFYGRYLCFELLFQFADTHYCGCAFEGSGVISAAI